MLSAQHEGREFWFTCGMKPEIWPYAGIEPSDSAIIYILGHHSCTGYVQNPYSSFYKTFELYPDSLITVTVPANELFHISSGFVDIPFSPIQGATIVIRTTENVQVWCQSPRFTDYTLYPTIQPSAMLHEYPFKIQLFPVNFYEKHYRIPLYNNALLILCDCRVGQYTSFF